MYKKTAADERVLPPFDFTPRKSAVFFYAAAQTILRRRIEMPHFTEPFAQSTGRSVLSADKIRRLQNIFAACGDRLKI